MGKSASYAFGRIVGKLLDLNLQLVLASVVFAPWKKWGTNSFDNKGRRNTPDDQIGCSPHIPERSKGERVGRHSILKQLNYGSISNMSVALDFSTLDWS